MKKIIRLTESDLHKIIKESVKGVIKEATAGMASGGGTAGFMSNIGNGSGLAAGSTTTQNTPQGNGDNTIFGKGLTSKKKKKSNTDIINHGRDIYNAKGDSRSNGGESSDFFGSTMKRHNGKGGSISIPKKHTNESINEGWKNWAATAALGAATMFGSPNMANAQTFNQNQNGTEQVQYDKAQMKALLQKWMQTTPVPSISKQEAQKRIFDNFHMSDYGKDEMTTKFLNSVLFKSANGKFIDGNNFSAQDIQRMNNESYGKVAIMVIDGVKYFVNCYNLANWDI